MLLRTTGSVELFCSLSTPTGQATDCEHAFMQFSLVSTEWVSCLSYTRQMKLTPLALGRVVSLINYAKGIIGVLL